MYIERQYDGKTECVKYVLEDGREFENIMVKVDGRRVAADIVQLDTTEGWVDIEMPEFESQIEISNVDNDISCPLESKINPNALATPPIFDPIIKRLTGKVQVYTL
jgi:hypothetical protein